ncbi:glycosyltransferase family 4 protein [Clostridium paraputrificum]|uniref:glycosyltransferase family 4 protein n=1 Tax=Clostridium paraputrificum TaxID=29363 RepID=UPI00374F8FF9
MKHNILHINSNFNQSNIHYELTSAFNNEEHVDGRVFFPSIKRGEIKDFNKAEYNNAEFVDRIYCLQPWEKYFFYARNYHMYKEVLKKYEIEKFNYIIAHSLFSNGNLALTLKKKFKIKYMVIVKNTDVNSYFKKRFLLRKKGIEILKNADLIVFSSEAYKNLVVEKYIPTKEKENIIKKSLVIPFGINEFWLKNSYQRKPIKITDRNLKILYVGKINKNKNIELTAKVCQRLIEKNINIQFSVVGECNDNDLKERLMKYKFLNIYPYSSLESILNYYRENDIFIMPSIYESFGLVYAEALSQSLPIIYTKGQGFDGHFPNGFVGCAVDSSSEDELEEAIRYVINNYENLSINAYNSRMKFSWESVARTVLEMI